MDKSDFITRTKHFSLRIIKLAEKLHSTGGIARILSDQIVRCGTSVGANYRAACLAKSTRDFLNKLKICEEESDETVYWLELLMDSNILPTELLRPLHEEARQLTAMITASIKTVKRNQST
ncbi:MAG: four helix bundle protein, partial [Akkermansia sp.]|nr:four helix bundle protein [Akkermansia sp.]